MRIAYLVTDFPSASSPGRVNEIEGVLERGNDIRVYSTNKPPANDYASISDGLSNRITYTHIPNSILSRVIQSIPHLYRIAIKNPTKLQIFVNPLRFGRDAVGLIPAYRASPLASKTYPILHAHRGREARMGAILKEAGICDNLVATFHGYGVRHARMNPDRYQHLFSTGDMFLAISKHIYDELHKLGVDRERLKLHPIGIDMSRFRFRWSKVPTTVPEPLNLITVGALREVKGIEYGIRAVRMLRDRVDVDFEYHIVGGTTSSPDSKSHEEYLHELADDLDVSDSIVFHGHVPRKEVINLLEDSHIYLLTSIEEGLATVLLEAQAVGLPIVTTDAGGTRDAVSNIAKIVPPAEAESIVSAISELMVSPNSWPELGRVGRDYVKDKFSTDSLNDDLVGTYKSLLEDSNQT